MLQIFQWFYAPVKERCVFVTQCFFAVRMSGLRTDKP